MTLSEQQSALIVLSAGPPKSDENWVAAAVLWINAILVMVPFITGSCGDFYFYMHSFLVQCLLTIFEMIRLANENINTASLTKLLGTVRVFSSESNTSWNCKPYLNEVWDSLSTWVLLFEGCTSGAANSSISSALVTSSASSISEVSWTSEASLLA